MCLALAASGNGFGQSSNQAPAPPQLPSSSPAQGASPAPAAPPQGEPTFRPGFLHQLKTWWDDSLAVFDRKDKNPSGAASDANKKPEDTSPGVADKAKEAATSAVTTTQDAMKSAVEATKGAASSAVEATKGAASTATDAMKGAVEATKNAATAIVRLPNTRVIQVSEVCARAPNGGSDCAMAAANGCRARGFAGGTPLDVRTGSRCDPKPPQAGETPSVHCSSESVVTRAVCQ
jgi:colicin import membrane protein